ncbi:MAG TPA: TonB family protein [Sphingomicrobium sp.]
MPASDRFRHDIPPRERALALSAVALVQVALGLVLLSGFKVTISRSAEVAERLIEIVVPPLEAPKPKLTIKPEPARHAASAPKAQPAPPGGSPGPQPAHAPPSVAPIVPIRPSVAVSGGGRGVGPALGSGSGGGTGGNGNGDSAGGGTDLEQIAGEITPRDVPRHLREAGIGGTVGFLFTVGVNGRVTRCAVTRSSGVPELDALTCRLVQQRFVYRPATDRYGRPVSDEVEGEQEWIPTRR